MYTISYSIKFSEFGWIYDTPHTQIKWIISIQGSVWVENSHMDYWLKSNELKYSGSKET